MRITFDAEETLRYFFIISYAYNIRKTKGVQ